MNKPPATDAEITSAIRHVLPDTVAAYVFGSAARNELRPGSDIDIAVLGRTPLTPGSRFQAQESLAVRLGIDIDLIDLLGASTVLRFEVITTGRLLFCVDQAAREQFEDLAYSMYARFNEERAEILAQITRDGNVYGR